MTDHISPPARLLPVAEYPGWSMTGKRTQKTRTRSPSVPLIPLSLLWTPVPVLQGRQCLRSNAGGHLHPGDLTRSQTHANVETCRVCCCCRLFWNQPEHKHSWSFLKQPTCHCRNPTVAYADGVRRSWMSSKRQKRNKKKSVGKDLRLNQLSCLAAQCLD